MKFFIIPTLVHLTWFCASVLKLSRRFAERHSRFKDCWLSIRGTQGKYNTRKYEESTRRRFEEVSHALASHGTTSSNNFSFVVENFPQTCHRRVRCLSLESNDVVENNYYCPWSQLSSFGIGMCLRCFTPCHSCLFDSNIICSSSSWLRLLLAKIMAVIGCADKGFCNDRETCTHCYLRDLLENPGQKSIVSQ